MREKNIKQIVKERYGKIAETEICCGTCNCNSMDNSELAKTLGYSEQEINAFPEANLGLGCGNPTALGEIKKGDVVLDLGSGAGFDAFLASKRVGENGKVIGVDMTPEMIKKAKDNAKKYNYKNVEFKLGDIEELPIQDNSIDVIISNCVINLAPDKDKVFSEAHRVLKKGGKIFVSDIVLTGELTKEQKNDEELLAGCVGGALQKVDYINKIKNAGFEVKVLGEDKDISQRQYAGLPLESLKVEAIKELTNEYWSRGK